MPVSDEDLARFDRVLDITRDEFVKRISSAEFGFKRIGSGMFGSAYANKGLVWKLEFCAGSASDKDQNHYRYTHTEGWTRYIVDVKNGVFGKTSKNVPEVGMLVLLADGIAALIDRLDVVGKRNNSNKISPRNAADISRVINIINDIDWNYHKISKGNVRQKCRAYIEAHNYKKTLDRLDGVGIRGSDAVFWFAKNRPKILECGITDLHTGNIGLDRAGNIVFFDPVS